MKNKIIRYGLLLFIVLIFNNSYPQLSINQPALDSLLVAYKKSHSTSLAVFFNGKSLVDYTLDKNNDPIACYSVLKSIAALAVGKLIEDGKIANLNNRVSDFYPEWKQGLKNQITIKHLLNHTSGIECNNSDDDYFSANNVVQHALCTNVTDTPGTKFVYNSKAFLLLLGIIGKASGKATNNYIEQKHLRSSGIKNFKWKYDFAGNVTELLTTSSELVKIGKLVLNKGSWNNSQVISKGWITRLLEPSQPFVRDCGLLWWLIPETTYYIVDDTLLSEFKKAGISEGIISKFKGLKGVYVNENISADKLKAAFGEDWQTVLDKEFIPIIPYEAEGSTAQKS